jgi:hypothetical protein
MYIFLYIQEEAAGRRYHGAARPHPQKREAWVEDEAGRLASWPTGAKTT